MKKGGKGVQGVIGSWSRVKTLNIYWPHLSRELIILQLNIRTIPSGWDLFLPLSERNKRFIAGQLTALVKLRENLNAYFFFLSLLCVFFCRWIGGRQGQECNRPVKHLQRGATSRGRETGDWAGGEGDKREKGLWMLLSWDDKGITQHGFERVSWLNNVVKLLLGIWLHSPQKVTNLTVAATIGYH